MSTATLDRDAPKRTPWMTVRGVSKQYGGVHAPERADLELLPGEVHGVIGPNGAGKSTLAKILAAAIHADSGAIAIDGEEVHLHDPAAAQRHRLVLMPQEIAVVPTASVIDNVTLGAEAGRYGFRSPRACRTNAEAALAAVGLDVDPEALAGTLSAAHQRLLMMARALDRDARLLILDEPTAGLAQHEAELVGAAVRRLLDRDVTVIYVSHHLSEVAGLCERVTRVREGRVTATLAGVEVTKDALVSMLLDVPAGSDAAGRPAPVPPSGTDRNGAGGPQVELEGVTGGRLRDVSVYARSGEVTGMTGLLGSGVAEVVSMIVGATQPQSGAVRVGGEQVSLTSPAMALDRGIGYLAGDRTRAAFTGMSIRANVSVAALARWFGRLGLIRRKQERSKVDSHLTLLSVHGDPDRPLGALSGGNQQRALVARLLAADVKIVVLDEPTVGVDIHARAELWRVVRALAPNRTVIVASGEPEEFVALCDRVVCIRHGRVAGVLENAEITEREITRVIS